MGSRYLPAKPHRRADHHRRVTRRTLRSPECGRAFRRGDEHQGSGRPDCAPVSGRRVAVQTGRVTAGGGGSEGPTGGGEGGPGAGGRDADRCRRRAGGRGGAARGGRRGHRGPGAGGRACPPRPASAAASATIRSASAAEERYDRAQQAATEAGCSSAALADLGYPPPARPEHRPVADPGRGQPGLQGGDRTAGRVAGPSSTTSSVCSPVWLVLGRGRVSIAPLGCSATSSTWRSASSTGQAVRRWPTTCPGRRTSSKAVVSRASGRASRTRRTR